MSKRTLLLVVALIVSLAVASTGTLAYLTATDSDVNVMTLGNVDIEQIELQRTEAFINRRSGGHTGLLAEGDLEAFQDGKPLYPAYPANGETTDYSAEMTDLLYWGPYVTAESDGTENGAGNGLWNDSKLKGAVDKFVFVKNTGASPVYYRTVFAFECPEGVEYSEGPDKQLMMNVNSNSRFLWQEHGYITVDSQRYLLMSATYLNELPAGEISRPSLLQVVMTHNATGGDVAKIGETYEILVVSQAVATENMPDAATALEAAFGQLSKTSHPWLAEGEEGAQPPYESEPEIPDFIMNEAQLKEATTAGGSYAIGEDFDLTRHVLANNGAAVTLDLNGHQLTSTASHYIVAQNGGQLHLTGEGTVNMSMGFYTNKGNASITVDGGTYSMSATTTVNKVATHSVIQNNSSMVINGGTFISNVENAALFHATSNGILEINGGFFASAADDTPDLLSLGTNKGNTNRIILKGGTFVNYNPMDDIMTYKGEWPASYSQFSGPWILVWDGYTVVSETQPNGDVWYSVVPE